MHCWGASGTANKDMGVRGQGEVEESREKDPTSKRKNSVGWKVGFLFQAFGQTLLFWQMDSVICYINDIL